MDLLPIFSPCRLLKKITSTMGCVCLKPSVTIEGVRYTVLRQIAEGGFSTVDLVQDSRTGKRFALKRIICHSVEDQQVAQREVEVTRNLHHPGIVRLVATLTQGTPDIVHNQVSEVFLLLPFYPRGTLHDELERRRLSQTPFPQNSVLTIFSAVCSAVGALHSADPPLAHRDIKPHNVLLDKDLSPVLMDLGSASEARIRVVSLKEAQYLQDTAAERCSMTYRPPELFQVSSNCALDERTDVWSLGCLLYALMFFESPFDSVYERGDSVALAVQGGRISFPSNEIYSSSLLDLVTMMTNQDINFRPGLDSILSKIGEIMEEDLEQL